MSPSPATSPPASAAPRPAKGKTAAEALLTAGALTAGLVLLNVFSCQVRTRLDLTENQVYSLSSASAHVVQGLPEKVTIRAYFGNVPAEQSEKQNFVDLLLSEYADASGGKIVYEKLDPTADPAHAKDLSEQGITPLRLTVRRDDKLVETNMYFHVVFSHLDQREIWRPEGEFSLEGLEYDFTSRVKRMGYGKKKVAVTTGFGEPAEARALALPGTEMILPGLHIGLGDLYDVQTVDWSKEPDKLKDFDVVIVNGPTRAVSEAAKLALDHHVMEGKGAVFLVGGMTWTAGGQDPVPGMEAQDRPLLGMPAEHGLDGLLAAYGFQLGKDVLLDGRNSARLIVPPGARGAMLTVGFAPLGRSLADGRREILEGIDGMALPLPSSVTLTGQLAQPDGVATEVIPLVQTVDTSFRRTEVMAIGRTTQLTRPANAERGPFLVGVAASARFPSAFPNQAGAAGATTQSPSHTRLVLLAAPWVASDQVLLDIQRHGDVSHANGMVALHNLVDWVADDPELIAVRGKRVERTLGKLEPTTQSLVKYGNVVGAPLLVALIGLVSWRVRERRRRHVVL